MTSQFAYVASAQTPTAVSHALLCSFTGENEHNLIVAKRTRIEVHTLTPDGLVPELDMPIYGAIDSLTSYRPEGSATDHLVILTGRYKFCVLSFDAQLRRLVTVANGDMKDKVGRPVGNGAVAVVDPDSRVIGMLLYEGTLKVVPIEGGTLREAYNVRLAEVDIQDVCWLYDCPRPTLCVLHKDTRNARHVKTYVLDPQERALLPGPWNQQNVEHQADLLIPVPPPCKGVIVVGAQTISYHTGRPGSSSKSIAMYNRPMTTYAMINGDPTRFLLGDETGHLHVLALECNDAEVVGLSIDNLGQTSIANKLCYLDNGVVFVGSRLGDSQLVKLLPEPENGTHVQVLEEYLNIGPIVDMCVIDADHHGQPQAVTCSGAFKDGSLRVVRSGVGINEQASIELPGIKGIWSLRPYSTAEHDKYLVQSFIGETRVLAIQDDELGEVEIPGFFQGQTLYTGNVVGDAVIQITTQGIRLVACDSLEVITEWTAPAPIIVATANTEQVAVALSGGQVLHLEVVGGQLVQQGTMQLEHDAACLSLRPFAEAPSADGTVPMSMGNDSTSHSALAARSNLLAVCLWTDMSVRLYALPDMHEVYRQPLGVDTQARDVMLITLESTNYVVVGMGDGAIILFALVISTETGLPELTSRKRVVLGTHPIALSSFPTAKHVCVFASCDRPTVIYSTGGKLVFANVNVSDVSHMAPFNSEMFPECLAMVSEAGLTIGVVDDIQKLHIRKIALNESPRRIAFSASHRAFAVCLTNVAMSEEGEESKDRVAFFDHPTFEELHSYSLDPYEQGLSCTTCEFDGAEYLVVGTSYVIPGEDEPCRGRVLVFTLDSNRHGQLVTAKEVRGAIYSMRAFNGKLVAGIGSKVQLFRWADRPDGVPELQTECGHHGHILVLFLRTHGDLIIVGDIMRSIVVLQYKEVGSTIEEVARDFNAHYMRGVEVVDGLSYLGADDYSNLFVMQATPEAAAEEDKTKLHLRAEFHLGDDVNAFCKGGLNVQLRDPDEEALFSQQPILFGCVSGGIGCIIPLHEELYRFFSALEKGMRTVVNGIGGFNHEEWRAFFSEHRSSYAFAQSNGFNKNIVDGDLVETLIDLPREQMEQIIKFVNDDMISNGFITTPIPFDVAVRRVEEMTRAH